MEEPGDEVVLTWITGEERSPGSEVSLKEGNPNWRRMG